MYKLYEHLKDERICLSYLGLITDSVTEKFISLSEFYMASSANLSKIKNRTSFLIVECFQNTVRHGEKGKKVDNHKDYFQINAWDGGVVLSSCNLVEEKHVEELRNKITHVNSLQPHELKKMHEEILTRGELSNKGGAGLGLIDMARKTGMPIRYNFTSVKNDTSEFFMALEIINQQNAIHVPRISLYLKKEIDFYKELVKQNALLLYRGEISKETMMPLIDMLEHNVVENKDASSAEKKRLITIIEVLQNISKHGKVVNGARNGIFSIAEVDGNFVIECGNFVEEKDAKSLKEFLDSVQALTLDEVSALYKKKLANPDISEQGNSGLGLLEIIRNCGKKFSYTFEDTSENETFFSLKITLQ